MLNPERKLCDGVVGRGFARPRQFKFPVDHAIVLDRIGDVTIDAPDEEDSETIGDALTSDNDATYETADDLFESIFGNLDDNYIGRKYCDDRGATIEEGDGRYPRDEEDESF